MKQLSNPFSVLKATEFTNEEINNFWVDFSGKANSVFNILNPSSDLPKYLLGSKGTGKTHMLKYASYPVQKIKAKGDFSQILMDGYIGLYYELYGIDASRFKGKGIEEDQWSSVFEYYLDLFIVDKLLKTYKEIFVGLSCDKLSVSDAISEVCCLFSNVDSAYEVNTIDGLLELIRNLRNKVDMEINNVAHTKKFELSKIQSVFTPGNLIFGIPEIFEKKFSVLKGIRIIYILDEIEKLEEWQKRYINTLVWDKRKPVTFWLGMRTWGYTVWDTKTSEIIRDGHEFSKIDLDEFISSDESRYSKFVKKLCLNRLQEFYKSNSIDSNFEHILDVFMDKFETYDETKLVSHYSNLGYKKELVHLSKLRDSLNSFFDNSTNVELLIKALIGDEKNPLFQKYKIFKFYQEWNKQKKQLSERRDAQILFDVILEINAQYELFTNGRESYFDEIVDKRKKDFIAQLCFENKEPHLNIEHSGLPTIIERSQCNPRNFLMILMKCIEIGNIKEENPLEEGGKISLNTQFEAFYDTAEWVFKTVEVKGIDAKRIYDSLRFLTDILMLYRYCDKPTETSVFGFNVSSEDLNEASYKQLNDLVTYNILIEDGNGRKEKNSSRIELRYNLNKILCPLWGLPIKKRGVLDLNDEMASVIFDEKKADQFENYYKRIKVKLNAPFVLGHPKKPKSIQSSLEL